MAAEPHPPTVEAQRQGRPLACTMAMAHGDRPCGGDQKLAHS
jgi:hypothetical protein